MISICMGVTWRKALPYSWMTVAESHATYSVLHIATAVYPLWRFGALRATVLTVIQLLVCSATNAHILVFNAREVAGHVFLDAVASAGHYALHTALGITAVPRLFGSFWAWLVVNQMFIILVFYSMRGMHTRMIEAGAYQRTKKNA